MFKKIFNSVKESIKETVQETIDSSIIYIDNIKDPKTRWETLSKTAKGIASFTIDAFIALFNQVGNDVKEKRKMIEKAKGNAEFYEKNKEKIDEMENRLNEIEQKNVASKEHFDDLKGKFKKSDDN
jgi:uncharacterized protein YydD (DUF2326 family)